VGCKPVENVIPFFSGFTNLTIEHVPARPDRLVVFKPPGWEVHNQNVPLQLSDFLQVTQQTRLQIYPSISINSYNINP